MLRRIREVTILLRVKFDQDQQRPEPPAQEEPDDWGDDDLQDMLDDYD